MNLPEYRIITRTMHGGRVWLIPQYQGEGGASGEQGWQGIEMRGGLFQAQYAIDEDQDYDRAMTKAMQAITHHKNGLTAEEAVVWQEPDVRELVEPVAGESA